MLRILPVILTLFSATLSPAQNLREKELFLQELAFIVLKGETDSASRAADSLLTASLAEILEDPASVSYPFDSLKYVSVLSSPDKLFRIFSWYRIDQDGEHHYSGILQFLGKKKTPVVTVLQDKTDAISEPEKQVLDADNWIGALYYDIASPRKNKRRQYLLLGWDGHNPQTNRKIIEVLSFSSRGVPRFGSTLRYESKPVKRIIFEYGEGVVMSLKYHPQLSAIIFDHLAPSAPHLKDTYAFYGPDFSFDALIYEKGRWVYVKDVDARNPKTKREYNDPER